MKRILPLVNQSTSFDVYPTHSIQEVKAMDDAKPQTIKKRFDLTLKTVITQLALLFASFCFIGSASAAIIDDFADGDFVGWTIVDEGTVTAPSNWSVVNGELRQNSNIYGGSTNTTGIPKPGTYALYDAGNALSDYQLQLTIRGSDDDGIGVMFRVQDADNYYRFSMDTSRSYRRLVKKVGGVFTVLWEDNVAYTQNQNYVLSISAQGSNIAVDIDGTPLTALTDNSIAQGSFALYSWGQTGAFFDDIDLQMLGGSDAPPTLTINQPANGFYSAGDAVPFASTASDFEDGDISNGVQWSSDLDGNLGNGNFSVTTLSNGTHSITASITDSASNTTTQNTSIVIAPATSQLLIDNFDDGDFSEWTIVDEAGVSPVSSWSAASGALVQSANTYGGSTNATGIPKPGTYAVYSAGSSWTDYRLSVDLTSNDDDGIGVLFRYQDDNNYYRFSMDTSRSYRRLVKKENGTFTVLYQDTVQYAQNQTYALAVSAIGTALTVELDGQTITTQNDASFTQGSVALYNWGNTGSRFDNVRVTDLSSGTAPTINSVLPATGTSVGFGDAVAFSANATDTEDGDISNLIQWSSDLDGALGAGGNLNLTTLSIGTHLISVSVTDSGNKTASQTLTLIVTSNLTQLLADNFNDGDFIGWTIVDEATATPSSAWSVSNGELLQSSNIYGGSTNATGIPKPGSYAQFNGGSSWSDYQFTVDLRSSDDDGTGVMFRVQDSNNYYRFSMDTSRSYRRLVKKVNGTFTVLYQDAVQYTQGQNYSLSISAEGSALSVQIDGQTIASVNDASLTQGSIALYNWGNAGSYYDNVLVYDLATQSNSAPSVALTLPTNGSNFNQGDLINFAASASDVEDGDLSSIIQWSSNLDGNLGSGANISSASLSVGNHIITASVTDAGALSATATTNVTVNAPVNMLPSVSITSPANNFNSIETTIITFNANASDAEDGDLSANVQWSSDRDGNLGTGASIVTGDLTVGTHQIQAQVSDSQSANANASITVNILANTSPVLNVLQPGDGSAFDLGAVVSLQANATDNEDGDLTSAIRWASDVDGELGFGSPLDVSTLNVGSHLITASVNDSFGVPAIASIVITINNTTATAVDVTYQYNAMGQRTSKTQNGETIFYVYDLQGRVIAELDTNGNTTREYIYNNGEAIALVDKVDTTPELYYIHNDHLATPKKVTDQNQQVVWAADYQPFGIVDVTVNTIDQNFRFPGQYYDEETGLHYNYFRDYDASLGRYIESDPIGLMGGINTYAYVGGNPLFYSDPYGLVKWEGHISVTKVGIGYKGIGLFYDSISISLKSECVDGREVFVKYSVEDIDSLGANTGPAYAYSGSISGEDERDTPELNAGLGDFKIQIGGVLRHGGNITIGSIEGETSGGSPSIGAYAASGKIRSYLRDFPGKTLHIANEECSCEHK